MWCIYREKNKGKKKKVCNGHMTVARGRGGEGVANGYMTVEGQGGQGVRGRGEGAGGRGQGGGGGGGSAGPPLWARRARHARRSEILA